MFFTNLGGKRLSARHAEKPYIGAPRSLRDDSRVVYGKKSSLGTYEAPLIFPPGSLSNCITESRPLVWSAQEYFPFNEVIKRAQGLPIDKLPSEGISTEVDALFSFQVPISPRAIRTNMTKFLYLPVEWMSSYSFSEGEIRLYCTEMCYSIQWPLQHLSFTLLFRVF